MGLKIKEPLAKTAATDAEAAHTGR